MASSRYKKIILGVLAFVSGLVLIAAAAFFYWVNPQVIPNHSTPVIITLEPATSAHQFVQLLKEKKLIHSKQLVLYLIRYKGLAHQLKAGVYQIQAGERILSVLNRVAKGDVIIQNFTIIAGTTQQKIIHDLSKAPYLNYQSDDWKSIQDNHPNAEGLLLADTYQYRGGSTSKGLIEQAHRNLVNYLNKVWNEKDSNLPYKNPYELLIAASIIEKETGVASERKLISGIIVNRLRKNMPLQMDPTVIYGLGNAYKGKLSHNDLLIESAYNSYKNKGLPPTPISSVSKETLDAVAHPQLSNYIYFVAKGDGSHQFSETYEQQKRAIYFYQKKDL